MSFNTPSNPTLDRSSVTPPQPPPAQVRVGPRMKPQSERYKRVLREAHPHVVQRAREYVEDQKRQSRLADNPSNRPVWMELDSDDAGAGPLDKDDAVYQGRSARSRIASVQASREGVIHTRRSRARERASPDLQSAPPAQPHDGHSPEGRGAAVERDASIVGERAKGRKKKTYKTPSIVITSGDEEQDSALADSAGIGKRQREDTLEVQRSERKKHRTNRPVYDWPMTRTPPPPSPRPPRRRSLPPPPALVSEPELPSLLDIMNEELGGPELLDDEAVESGGEEVSSNVPNQGGYARSPNEYDLDDPFINDDDESSASDSSSSCVRRSRKRPKSSLSSPFKLAPKHQNPSSDDGRSSDSDDSPDEHGEVVLRRLSKGSPRKNRSSSPTDSHLEGNALTMEKPSYEVTWAPTDPASTKVEAPAKPRPRPVPKKIDSSNSSGLAQVPLSTTKALRASARDVGSSSSSPTRPVHHNEVVTSSKKDKGKAKASVVEEDMVTEDEVEDSGAILSEMSEWERQQFELAVFNSKRVAPTTSQGESSSQGTSAMSTPRATSLFTSASPALATPDATALFTSPSSNAALRPPNQPPSSPLANGAPLSMAELVRRSRASAADAAVANSAPQPQTASASTTTNPAIQLIIRVTESDIPDVDETLQAVLQDVILALEYIGLVRLRAGHFEPWGHMPGPGFVMFGAWGDQCPLMHALVALAAVNFMQSGVYRNPARSTPVGIGLYTPPGQKDRFNFYCAGANPEPLIAVTTGMLEDSQLTVPSDTGLRQKWVRVIMHSQEAQRYMGWVRMVTGHQHLYAQYNKHALQFSTRPMLRSPNNPNNYNKEQSRKDNKKGLRVDASKMFSAAGATGSGSGNRVSADNFSLPAEATVPVYDARRVQTFDFDANISRLAETLPLWTGGEIPYGSFVMVGHTLSLYRSQAGNWTLGCNLQWVVLVGNPDDD